MEFYSSIIKNEIMIFVEKWIQPELMILSKADSERQMHIFFMWTLDLCVYV